MDIQKAYDSVQHELLWARLQHIGVHGRMLGAIQSLHASGTISMKVVAQQGPLKFSKWGSGKGVPLSPTLFGLYFDGLGEQIHAALPRAGLQLGSGRCVPYLCYADDAVLMAESAPALQQLIDVMHGFCCGAGLTISIAKTEVVGLSW